MFFTSIAEEFRLACDLLDMESQGLAKFLRTAVDSSFAERDLKDTLHHAIEEARLAIAT